MLYMTYTVIQTVETSLAFHFDLQLSVVSVIMVLRISGSLIIRPIGEM
jgi:hypothetical protein